MNVLDYIFIAILLIFTIRGFARGLINEVFGIGSLIFSLFAVSRDLFFGEKGTSKQHFLIIKWLQVFDKRVLCLNVGLQP